MGRSVVAAGIMVITVILATTHCTKHEEQDAGDQWEGYVFVETDGLLIPPVDVLFIVDNSNSMLEEQANVAEQIEIIVHDLLAPNPDVHRDPPPPPIEDLHVGIITTDMGAGGHEVESCSNFPQGDDGVLRRVGNVESCPQVRGASDCFGAECPWLAHSVEVPDDGSDPENPPIWEDAACLAAQIGRSGCGYTAPLEASLRALTVHTEPGGPNDGFLRDDSLIVIMYITDGDDCSSPNAELFDPARDDLGPPGVRCATHDQMLYPVSRYYEALSALRPGVPDLVVAFGFAGFPIDGSWNVGESTERLRELRRFDPENPEELLPTCESGTGRATPPVRLAELAYMFGGCTSLWSICDPALNRTPLSFNCSGRVPRCPFHDPLPTDDPRRCRVVEVLHDGRSCPYPADATGADRTQGWQVDLGLRDEGRRQCEILPADYDGDGCPDGISVEQCEADDYHPRSGALQGWFYDDNDPICEFGQIRFTSLDVTSDLSDLLLACPE